MIRSAGVPVFRSSDQAIRSLGRYLCHRSKKTPRAVHKTKKALTCGVVPMNRSNVAPTSRETMNAS